MQVLFTASNISFHDIDRPDVEISASLITPHSSNFRFDFFISSLDKSTPDRDPSEEPDDGTPDDNVEDDDPIRSCGDELKGSTCSTFKSRGFCEKYPAIRNKRCRKSCGACQG